MLRKGGVESAPSCTDTPRTRAFRFGAAPSSSTGRRKPSARSGSTRRRSSRRSQAPSSKTANSTSFPLTPDQFNKVHKPEFGIPSLEMFSIGARSPINPTPDQRPHLVFARLFPGPAKRSWKPTRCSRRPQRDFGLPLLSFSLPSTYWTRSFIFLFGFPITHDIATNKKNRETFKQVIQRRSRAWLGRISNCPGVPG